MTQNIFSVNHRPYEHKIICNSIQSYGRFMSIHYVKQLGLLNIPTWLNAANTSTPNMLRISDSVASKFETEVNPAGKQFSKYHLTFQ